MHDNEPDTIKAWQNGDELAVQAIFNVYFPRAARLAFLSGLGLEEAEDCAQEAFLLAFERRRQLRNPVAFPLWFHRIVTRHILDFLRAQNHKKEVPLQVATELIQGLNYQQATQPDEMVITAEGKTELWQNIQQLSPHYRIPLVLRYYGGFSLHEIATIMGKHEGTIRVSIHRALHQLRLLSSKDEPVSKIGSVALFSAAHPAKTN